MIAIRVVTLMPDPPEPTGVSDKTLHLAAFGGLALLLLRALAGGAWRGVTRWTLIACVVIAVLYGIEIEWEQSFTASRTPELMDVVADLAGAAGAAAVAGAWSIIRRL